MSCGMPELGSRISLVSKADIRYEGRLFTVDPQECTIALAGVQSFGTEDRETACPIAPQSQIYEYILFRGSDIKDIRVINNCPIPNDPAIMQMHLPPQTPLLQSPFHQPGFNVPNPMTHGNIQPPVNAYNQMNPHSSFAKHNSSQNLASDLPSKQKPYDLLDNSELTMEPKPNSRSDSPSVNSRKSPTADSAVQTAAHKPFNRGPQHNQRTDNQHQRNNEGDMHRMNKPQHQHQQQGNRHYDGNNQNRPWNNQRNQNQRNRFRGGRPQLPQNASNAPRGGGNRGRNVLKFENDYDFEQANNKFEELRSQLSKLKVNEEIKTEQPPATAAVEAEKTEEPTNDVVTVAELENEDDIGYNKSKSFFDNISCEAAERSKGKTQRTDWRHEKKLNTETFGVSSNRRNNFRSRGGFNRNFNRNANFRDNFRGRSDNRNNANPNFAPANRNNQENTINAKKA